MSAPGMITPSVTVKTLVRDSTDPTGWSIADWIITPADLTRVVFRQFQEEPMPMLGGVPWGWVTDHGERWVVWQTNAGEPRRCRVERDFVRIHGLKELRLLAG